MSGRARASMEGRAAAIAALHSPPHPLTALVVVCSADMGAAYGTAKSGVAVAALGVMNPEMVMKSMIPVVMAGVIGIYGLIVAVIIVGTIPGGDVTTADYCAKLGFAHLGSGIAVGGSGLAAGAAIGMVGDSGARCTSQQPKLFVGMILILIFAEALGLYGLIVALVMSGASCTA